MVMCAAVGRFLGCEFFLVLFVNCLWGLHIKNLFLQIYQGLDSINVNPGFKQNPWLILIGGCHMVSPWTSPRSFPVPKGASKSKVPRDPYMSGGSFRNSRAGVFVSCGLTQLSGYCNQARGETPPDGFLRSLGGQHFNSCFGSSLQRPRISGVSVRGGGISTLEFHLINWPFRVESYPPPPFR